LKDFYGKVESKRGKKTGESETAINFNVAKDIVDLFKNANASNEEIYQALQDNFSSRNADLISFNKFYSILNDYTSKEFTKQQIEKNKAEISSKIGQELYKELLKNYSTLSYFVKVGDMVEFLGTERKFLEEKPYPNENLLKKYYFLDDGRKYKVTQVDPEEIGGVANSKIKVIDGSKKETEWLNTKEFKVGKSMLSEEKIIRKTISKKLFETYLKNKK
jgi:hypothetical protein